jgi:hypothetical protein
MTAIVLLLPALSLLDGQDLRDLSRELPRLASLLGRARRVARPDPFESTLLSELGLSPAAGLASLTALADFPTEDSPQPWLRSDPIYLHADPNKVLVQGRVRLDPDEAEGLLATLNTEFPELGFRRGRDPARWYVRQPADVSGVAPSRLWLHGRSLTPFMPQGAADRQWRRYLNDIQMVLHAHPVNEARAARGELPVNAVWWFGGGAPVELATNRQPTHFLGNDALLAGLARATGQTFNPQPTPAALLAGGRTVMLCGEGGDALSPELPTTSLETLEHAYLPMILRALFLHRISTLTILCGSHRLHLGSLQLLRLWRAPQRFHLE